MKNKKRKKYYVRDRATTAFSFMVLSFRFAHPARKITNFYDITIEKATLIHLANPEKNLY